MIFLFHDFLTVVVFQTSFVFVAVSKPIKCQKNCMIREHHRYIFVFKAAGYVYLTPSNHQDMFVSEGISAI